MTEWTDEELRAADDMTIDFRNAPKGCAAYTFMRRFLAKLGVVHPHDARERERKAWDEALIWSHRHSPWRPDGFQTPSPDMLCAMRELETRYPSLRTPEPSPLVLSTGTWTRHITHWVPDAGGVAFLGKHPGSPIKVENGVSVETMRFWKCDARLGSWDVPVVSTASDARALAKWLAEFGSEDEKK